MDLCHWTKRSMKDRAFSFLVEVEFYDDNRGDDEDAGKYARGNDGG